ncbi:diacylglycerol kinase family protein [Aquipuribacter nitratireducens]|uniref:Diacylglycerol kinase family protein n=1 Tax=Aquipuribacter nitratireducens TaxID=650104 RepID=A0ABW0GKQ9_9MICO
MSAEPAPRPAGDRPRTPGARVALLVNPSAGAGRGAALGRAATQRLRALGHDVHDVSAADGSAAARAAADAVGATGADRPDALVVVGGDGMVHLGVGAVAHTGVPLGVVPAGTGNDIARAWGLPGDPVAAVDTLDACLRAGWVAPFDAVRVDDPGSAEERPAWVGGVVAAGFDAVVNERANGWRWPRGAARYNLAIARELPVFRPVPYRLVLDGEEWRTEGLLVAVANTGSYGGGMRIAPDATPDDGLLDVVVVTPVSLPRFVRLFPKVYDGTHVDVDAVEVRRARTVEVHVDAGGRHPRRIVAYGDGERLGELPRRFTAVPGAVAVLTPRAA